jgi:hypothetical protein
VSYLHLGNVNEMLLAAQLLEMASSEFANHGCNDFEIPMTEENVVLIQEAQQADCGIPPEHQTQFDPKKSVVTTHDWLMMNVLAQRLTAAAASAGLPEVAPSQDSSKPIGCPCGVEGCPTGPECFGGSDY